MVKRIFLIVIAVCCLSRLSAEEPQPISISKQEKSNLTFYAGVNPLALIAFLPRIGTVGTVYGVLSGQEFGASIYGGMNFAKAHTLEMRLSTGPADVVTWDTQLQLGYIWYPLEQLKDWKGGLCAGFMARQFFWNNRITDYATFNFTPELLIGWRFKVKPLAFDLRGGWNFASVTCSDIPHTKVGTGWTPFPYNLTLTFGIAWMFNSRK